MKPPSASRGEAPVPSDPGLDVLPAPAAVFDAGLRLLRANARFLELCPTGQPGAPLAALLSAASGGEAPAVGEATCTFLARSCTGALVEVSASHRGDAVGVLLRPMEAGALGPAGEFEDRERAEAALLALSRELILAGSEEVLVAAIARCIRHIFPSGYFCVRVVEPDSGALHAAHVEGPLREACRASLELRRGAAEKAHIDLRHGAGERVVLTDAEPRVFEGTVDGFATPLVAAGAFFGVINLEFPAGVATDLHRDAKLLIQLANQAAVGIRNARLIHELTLVKGQLEEVIENANALILVFGRDRNVRVFNRALEQLTGFRRAQVLGRDVLELVAPPLRAEAEAFCEASFFSGPHSTGEVGFELVNGMPVRISAAVAAVAAPSGEVDAVIIIGQDLTRQNELERRVVQAEKLASLGQLAAGVVHELNNPLTTISLYTESLLQLAPLRRAEPGDVEKLRRIQESAERMQKFARDLTAYAKPAQDQAQLFDVHHVIDQAAGYCEHAFKQARAVLRRSYAQGLPALHGVRSNLVQVFVNLLTNACHAMPESGGEVTVSTRTHDGGVEIDVADTGGGIAAENLPYIFEPFFTTKTEGRGTGLGLTVVQGILEKHGGTIEARSLVGRGTTFVVWLPCAAEPGSAVTGS